MNDRNAGFRAVKSTVRFPGSTLANWDLSLFREKLESNPQKKNKMSRNIINAWESSQKDQ